MTEKKDATVIPQTINFAAVTPATVGVHGMVNPLDLLVTEPILKEASRLTKRVASGNFRLSEKTVNILNEFLDVPLDSELSTIEKPGEVVMWLADRAHDRGEDPAKLFGQEIYQNITNLVKRGFLREPTEGMEYNTPALQTTPKGVAYMVWHGQRDHDDLLRMLVTGMVKDTGAVLADVSDVYTTPYPKPGQALSGIFNSELGPALDSYVHHLRGADSARYLRDLSAGVFNKDHKKVWKSLGTVQIQFVRQWVHQHVQPASVADSYLTNEILPCVERIAVLLPKLAELLGYTDPEGEDRAENEVIEEICRIGWALLKAAGDEATGVTAAANRETLTAQSVREQMDRLTKNTKQMILALAKNSGLDKFRPDYLIEFDDGQIIIEHKRGKGRPPTEEEQKDLLERISRAATFIETGDPAEVMNYDWDAVEAEIAEGMADWEDRDD